MSREAGVTEQMRRCLECGRPYRGGLSAPALLELALQELSEADLSGERLTDLARVRKTARAASDRLDQEMTNRADQMVSS